MKPRILTPGHQNNWSEREARIWSCISKREDSPVRSVLTTLWDQPRWLEAYHLYDERGAELFEEICRLPEYYLTRTEDAILQNQASRIITAARVEAIVELGAGSSEKTRHLLREQVKQRNRGMFVPVDVSLPGLTTSRDIVQREYPELEFCGLHGLYEDAFSNIDKTLPKLIIFLGSTIGNFNHTEFPRFFRHLIRCMGPDDFFLLGADQIKPANLLEKAYDDSRGVTAEFILNVFDNVNRLANSNFDRAKMHYYCRYNSEWQQVEMYAIATARQEISFASFAASFQWDKDEKILVEISRKFDPVRLQQQLRFFDLEPVSHYTDSNQWFSLLLFKKRTSQLKVER